MVRNGTSARGRRQALSALGALGALAMTPALCAASVPALGRDARIVVLDWGLTEVVLSLGVVPVGVARPVWYMRLDGHPPLPSSVADTGLLFQPNFEVLAALKPDVIVVTPWHAPLFALLERVAPVLPVTMFGAGLDIYPAVRAATRRLGAALGRTAEADALLQRTDRRIAAAAQTIAAKSERRRPLYLLRPIDARHVTVAGPHSLFDGVMRQLGLVNAWQGATDAQGMAEADLPALVQHADAQAVLLGAPPSVMTALAGSPLWQALPFVAERRVRQIGAIPPAGGVVAAMRFAAGLADALQGASR